MQHRGVAACFQITLSSLVSRVAIVKSVCLEGALWQNGWLDPDADWSGEWEQSKDGCIRWGWRSSKGKYSFGVNVRHPIVTNGDFGHSYSRPWGVAMRLFPNYFGISCLYLVRTHETSVVSISSGDSIIKWMSPILCVGLLFRVYAIVQHSEIVSSLFHSYI